jgi:cytochrome oxidase Cu insertion factor (SCO1/SenC/PrrC family)
MRRLSITVSPALLLLLLGWLQGCQWMQNRKAQAVSQPAKTGVEVGQVAPDIDGDDLNGQHLHLADYRGQVVVLTFWSKT